MNKTNLLIAGLIVLLILVGVAIYKQKSTQTEVVTQEPPVPSAPAEPVKVPIVHYPVAEPNLPKDVSTEQPQEPLKEAVKLKLPTALPSIDHSDASLQETLQSLSETKPFMHLLVMDHFIPKLVVTIDNLPSKKLPQAHLPLKTPKGRFQVSGTLEAPQTSRQNQKRYVAYVKLLESLEPELIITVYRYYYPLFQEAYKQLGYRNAYFNDRLIQVLDHLQETPNPTEPLTLSQPAVLYTFADPSLEKLSSGQKILLRMGPDNRQRTLKVLARYRQLLVSQ
ncbi:MAG TPA: DUF3014 domain-containing protein [Malonomonas sp.]